jgi:hypothetical protein
MTIEKKPQHGRTWRVLAHREGRSVEVENDGTFDELVVDDWLHVEQMEANVWWLRVGDARLIVTLDMEGQPSLDVQRGFYGTPRGSTETHD